MSVKWRMAQLFERLWRLKQKVTYGTNGYRALLEDHNLTVLVWLYGLGTQKFRDLDVVEIGGGLYGILPFLEGARTRTNVDPLALEGTWYDGVNFVKARGEDCPLPDQSADVVFCSNVLNHVDDDFEVLHQIQRILRPGGILYLDVHLQPKSVTHPREYDPLKLHGLVSWNFDVTRYWDSSTWALFGESSTPENVHIWACKASVAGRT